MSGPRILVVDDEPQIHRFLRPALELEGYAVERADTAREALVQAARHGLAAILLDLGLPDMDGQALLLQLRALTQVPILVVSARGDDAGKVLALDAGADDYVPKPFAVPELLARLRACLRRALVQDGAAQPWDHHGLRVDLLRRTVQVDGAEVMLTPREYGLLEALVRNAGRVITHQQLLRLVWGPSHTADVQYLRVYVGHLRQKLGAEAARLIRTEAGVGYRLLETAPLSPAAAPPR
ncbi:MAG: response regulator [Janthinobacterium lividum]|jgi:two-component system KDP operon response regulator KdpE